MKLIHRLLLLRGFFHDYSGPILNPNLRLFGTHIQVIRQTEDLQVVGAARSVDNQNPKAQLKIEGGFTTAKRATALFP